MEEGNNQNQKILLKRSVVGILVLVGGAVLVAGLATYGGGFKASLLDFFWKKISSPAINIPEPVVSYQSALDIERAVISVVKGNSDAVVSVIQTKDVPILEQCVRSEPFGFSDDPFFRQFFGDIRIEVPYICEKGTQKKEVGGGTGFVISSDGLIVTNKHVVVDGKSQYTILTNSGQKLEARVLAKDPFQDFAILKVEASGLPTVIFGNSDSIEIGQFVIAIGNALGEFRNTVSFGVVSGIRRNISAFGPSGFREVLEEVIQTDAAINPGNSGGPLLNLKGEVVGINTAVAQDAQNIGFTIPINRVKRSIESFKINGKIVYPYLGVRYVTITPQIQKERNLPVDRGALLVGGDGEPAVVKDSPAEKSGFKAGDILLEVNGERIVEENTLSRLLQKYQPKEVVSIKFLRNKEERFLEVILGEQVS
ncbi:PDZ domain-containing protein [Candidatus Parcubacteria bacterium]|nr:MAG: PDZ domain-containing protein [Candidatus Parcubacteria bacterium]